MKASICHFRPGFTEASRRAVFASFSGRGRLLSGSRSKWRSGPELGRSRSHSLEANRRPYGFEHEITIAKEQFGTRDLDNS